MLFSDYRISTSPQNTIILYFSSLYEDLVCEKKAILPNKNYHYIQSSIYKLYASKVALGC